MVAAADITCCYCYYRCWFMLLHWMQLDQLPDNVQQSEYLHFSSGLLWLLLLSILSQWSHVAIEYCCFDLLSIASHETCVLPIVESSCACTLRNGTIGWPGELWTLVDKFKNWAICDFSHLSLPYHSQQQWTTASLPWVGVARINSCISGTRAAVVDPPYYHSSLS